MPENLSLPSVVLRMAIAAGRRHSLGLCADGTVVAAGNGASGEGRVGAGLGTVFMLREKRS